MNILSLDARAWSMAEQAGLSRSQAEQAVGEAVQEAARLLPSEFEFLNVVISPGRPEMMIPETGVAGTTYSDEYISLEFDPALPHGTPTVIESLRCMTFHEMVHAATFAHDPWKPDVMFGAITEGLATVFERDYAASKPLWAEYESGEVMRAWYQELKNQPVANQKDRQYFILHDDGRKWIVYKTGTWIIDSLMVKGHDLFALMELDHRQIISLFEEQLAQ